MDHSKKPQKEHPNKNANILSQLFFGWIMPILYKGSRFGLTTEDLTKSLECDDSEDLGNRLEV